MNNQSNIDKERLQKLNDTFLYEVSYEHFKNIDRETDILLEKYKDIKPPETLNLWFEQYNKQYEAKKRREKVRRTSVKIGKRVASFLIIVILAGGILGISVEAFRVRFFNMVIETSQEFSMITNEESKIENNTDGIPSEWSNYYYPTYLPEGFSLTVTHTYNFSKEMEFTSTNGEKLIFTQDELDARTQLDTEGANTYDVEIQGNPGLLVIEENEIILIWANNESGFTLYGNVDKAEMLKVGESVLKNK